MKARIPNQGGQANMMKRIQQMQEEMARVQEEVENSEYTAFFFDTHTLFPPFLCENNG